MLTSDEEGDLASVDHDLFNRLTERGLVDGRAQGVGNVIEPATKGAFGCLRHHGGGDESAIARGVSGIADPEHPPPYADHLTSRGR